MLLVLMSRSAQIGLALFGIWLVGLIPVHASTLLDRGTIDLYTMLPIWGPLLAIALLSAAAKIERRFRR